MRLPFLRSRPAANEPAPSARSGRRKSPLPPPPGGSDEVLAARTRARQRLVGALVLLAVGIVGFPLLFDTQPRPLGVDTPIEVSGRPSASGTVTSTAPPRVAAVPLPREVPLEPVPAPASAPASAAAPAASAAVPTAAPQAAAPAASVPKVGAAARAVPPVAASAAAPRAASAPASASAPRFVVQVGAFTDAGALREARRRVESLGLKTYTQAVETPSGARTRVRVGPFDSRAEAEAAAKKLKAGGLPAAILAL